MPLSDQEIAERLAQVRAAYLANLQVKYDEIQTHWSALQTSWHSETFSQLYLILHGLAGSAETFGLVQVSENARQAVELCRAHDANTPLSMTRSRTLESALTVLLQSIASGLQQSDTGSKTVE